MRIYKPVIKQRNGSYSKTKKNYLEFSDHLGTTRRLAAFEEEKTKKGKCPLTEELARNVKELVKIRAAHIEPDLKYQVWLQTVPTNILTRLVEWGIVSGERASITVPLIQHVKEYKQELINRGNSQDYITRTPNRIKKIIKACKFHFFRDVTEARVTVFLNGMRKAGDSPTTIGHYQDAITGFLNWAVETNKINSNPLRTLTKPDRESEQKGVLNPEEFLNLLKTTFEKNILISDKYLGTSSGQERAVLYLLAGVTGLRRKELLGLTWADINLQGDNAFVKVPAKLAKNSKEALQPIMGTTIAVLTAYKAEINPNPTDRVFNLQQWSNTAGIMRFDLQAAGLPLKDREGNEICFHSLRNSFISFLANSNTPQKVTQKLARHSDPKLTFNTYARTFESTEKQAMKQLPNVTDFSSQFCLAFCLPKKQGKIRTLANSDELENRVFEPIKRVSQDLKLPPRGIEPLLPG